MCNDSEMFIYVIYLHTILKKRCDCDAFVYSDGSMFVQNLTNTDKNQRMSDEHDLDIDFGFGLLDYNEFNLWDPDEMLNSTFMNEEEKQQENQQELPQAIGGPTQDRVESRVAPMRERRLPALDQDPPRRIVESAVEPTTPRLLIRPHDPPEEERRFPRPPWEAQQVIHRLGGDMTCRRWCGTTHDGTCMRND